MQPPTLEPLVVEEDKDAPGTMSMSQTSTSLLSSNFQTPIAALALGLLSEFMRRLGNTVATVHKEALPQNISSGSSADKNVVPSRPPAGKLRESKVGISLPLSHGIREKLLGFCETFTHLEGNGPHGVDHTGVELKDVLIGRDASRNMEPFLLLAAHIDGASGVRY